MFFGEEDAEFDVVDSSGIVNLFSCLNNHKEISKTKKTYPIKNEIKTFTIYGNASKLFFASNLEFSCSSKAFSVLV